MLVSWAFDDMPAPNPVKSCTGCTDVRRRQSMPVEAQCTACRKKERNRLWRLANPGAMAANAKAWRAAGNKTERTAEYKEQHRRRERERYHQDPETNAKKKAAARARRARLGKDVLRDIHRAWRDAHPQRIKELRNRREAQLTKEARQERDRLHRERYRVQRQAGNAAYYARRYGGDAVITNEHLNLLHKWQDHHCFYCRTPLCGRETLEHVVPLSRGGTNNPHNVVLACVRCNTQKGGKVYTAEWAPASVEDAPRIHSVYGMQQVLKELDRHGVAYRQAADRFFIGTRPVFIVSSFWLAWKGDAALRRIKAEHPDAIIFFDKEFARRPDAVINVLKAKGGVAKRVGARQLKLVVPTPKEAQAFIGRWHAMGPTGGTMYLGLRDENEWWAIAAFRKEVDRYECIRMAIRETVAGGVSRINTHFRQMMPEPLPIVAFTDQRMGDGKSHLFAGFTADGTTERSFFYATPEAAGFYPRREFQKQNLAARGEFFDPALTQVVNAKANGLTRAEGLPRLRFVSGVAH